MQHKYLKGNDGKSMSETRHIQGGAPRLRVSRAAWQKFIPDAGGLKSTVSPERMLPLQSTE